MTRSTTRPSTRPALALAAGAALSLGLLAPSAAHADPVPPGAVAFTVTGHGYGHGHGMSQYGAQGAAKQGKAWRDIVGFYYPGTEVGKAGGSVRILLTAATKPSVQVQARPGLRLQAVGKKRSYRLDRVRPAAQRWKITPQGTRSVVTSKGARGPWRRLVSIPGPVEFTAGSRPVTLRLPKGATATYRGSLRAVDGTTINVVPLEQYLRGVVPSEVPAQWPAAAVQAQAVAARTYAAFERATATGSYDLCDTTACQVYTGADGEQSGSDDAVRATRRKVVTYQGAPAFTQFSSSNGGWSSAGSQPYLAAQQDPFEASSTNPYATWTATLTRAQVEKQWPQVGTLTDVSAARDGNGDWGGRVTSLTLTGTSGSVTVSGDAFRSAFGLRSTWFRLAPASAKQLLQRVLVPFGRR